MTDDLQRTDLFEEPDLPRVHARDYDVRAYRRDDGALLVRGAVRDVLPPGFYDQEPLVMHHMIVDLVVHSASMEILDVEVVFERHPTEVCPDIIGHYDNLVGLTIGRGFTHKIRELFGGPRACTHTTALLQAMAPVAMQAFLGSRIRSTDTDAETLAMFDTPEGRAMRIAGNRNTCHVWADGSAHVDHVINGDSQTLPIPIAVRLRERGKDPAAWPPR